MSDGAAMEIVKEFSKMDENGREERKKGRVFHLADDSQKYRKKYKPRIYKTGSLRSAHIVLEQLRMVFQYFPVN